jgi:uncharacterized repeat protein (TIGR01451 family)
MPTSNYSQTSSAVHPKRWALPLSILIFSGNVLAGTSDLLLQVGASPPQVVVGNTVTFTFSILNQGPDVATGVHLSNPLPPTTIFTGALVTNGNYVVSNNVFEYSLESLPVSAPVIVQMLLTPINPLLISNRTSVTAEQPDPITWNNLDQYSAAQVVAMAPGATLVHQRQNHTATLMQDGRVLIAGGDTWRAVPQISETAEVYDPVAEKFSEVGNMNAIRIFHSVTSLPDGTVLVVGGAPDYYADPMKSVDLFDPAKNVFVPTNGLVTARCKHSATLLPDGRVLVAGGAFGVTAVEFYDYKTGTFSTGGTLLVPRSGQVAALLPSGKVLFVGGGTSGPPAEVFDPATGTSHPAGGSPTNLVSATGISLIDGRVLLVDSQRSQIYDPQLDEFQESGTPLSRRFNPCLTLLNDGRVLISGGGSPLGYLQSTEVYDPVTGRLFPGSAMTSPRVYHTATRLQDGRVLIAAGWNGYALNTSEIYAVLLDMDQDGMEDSWELKYGFSPSDRSDAIQDADGDGLTNLQEYLAGTNPRDPNSIFRIETFQISSNTCRIRFNSVLGKHYRLERSTEFPGRNWLTVSNSIVASGTIMELLDPVDTRSSGQWYRVGVMH